jgi:catechol 2,3-dioxygenase-like lactoylglutathione lyase family enzyme
VGGAARLVAGALVPPSAAVIAGAHTIIYADDAEAARAFFRDVLGWPNVDADGGWLIFELPPGELAFHPDDESRPSGRHELFLMCHDIEATVAELKRKGVEFTEPITDEGFGLITRFKVPGAGEIGLYEPRHASPLNEFSGG